MDTDSAVMKIYDIMAAFRWTKNTELEKKKDDFE